MSGVVVPGEVVEIQVPRPNLCEISKTLERLPKRKKTSGALIYVQASPHFWSDFDQGAVESGPSQSFTFWDGANRKLGFIKSLRLSFKTVEIALTPSQMPQAEYDKRPATLAFLQFQAEHKCYKRFLKKRKDLVGDMTFVVDERDLSYISNPGLFDSFRQCVYEGETCKGPVRVTDAEPLLEKS